MWADINQLYEGNILQCPWICGRLPRNTRGPLWTSLSLNWSGVPWRIIALPLSTFLSKGGGGGLQKQTEEKRNWIQFLGKRLPWARLDGLTPPLEAAPASGTWPPWWLVGTSCWALSPADFEVWCRWWNPGPGIQFTVGWRVDALENVARASFMFPPFFFSLSSQPSHSRELRVPSQARGWSASFFLLADRCLPAAGPALNPLIYNLEPSD